MVVIGQLYSFGFYGGRARFQFGGFTWGFSILFGWGSRKVFLGTPASH